MDQTIQKAASNDISSCSYLGADIIMGWETSELRTLTQDSMLKMLDML